MRLSSSVTFFAVVCVLAVAAFTVAPVQADFHPGYNLTDGGASVWIDLDSNLGAYSWTMDGQDHLTKQWFWYRVAGQTSETSIDNMDIIGGPLLTGTNTLAVLLQEAGATPRFTMEVSFTLTGTSGTSSDMEESITIANIGDEQLNISFFQYVDFNLAGTAGNDTATVTIGQDELNQEVFQAATQVDGSGFTIDETVVTGSAKPVRFDVGDAATILGALTDGDLDDLSYLISGGSTTSYGPADAAWALQWNLSINPGGSVTISKDKALTIPEPATLSVMGIMAIAALRRRRGA